MYQYTVQMRIAPRNTNEFSKVPWMLASIYMTDNMTILKVEKVKGEKLYLLNCCFILLISGARTALKCWQ